MEDDSITDDQLMDLVVGLKAELRGNPNLSKNKNKIKTKINEKLNEIVAGNQEPPYYFYKFIQEPLRIS